MSTDTDLFAAELRDRLALDDLRAGMDPREVLTRSRRARQRRRAGIAGALAGALALAVVVSPLGVDVPGRIAEAMRTAPVSEVDPGPPDLGAPLRVTWQSEDRLLGVVEPSGPLLLSGPGHLTGVAPDGASLWSVATSGGESCWLPSPNPSMDPPVTTGVEAPVLCTSQTAGTIRVLDPQTGAALTSVHVDWPGRWSAGIVAGDVVAAGVDATGHVVATRWRLDGTVVWDQMGPVLSGVTSGRAIISITDAVVAVTAVDGGSVQLDSSTGEVRVAGGPVEQTRVSLPAGFTVTQLDWRSMVVDPTVRAFAPDGTQVLDVPGYARVPAADDGSVPGLLLVEDFSVDTIRAYDLTTGKELWHRFCRPSLIVDGRLIAFNSFDELEAFDARTGELLWQRTSDRATPDEQGYVSAITDGGTVVTVEHDAQPTLIGVDLATGALRWAVPWDGGYHTILAQVPGGVAASSADTGTSILEP